MRPLHKPVALVCDHLMPAAFFGPYICAYATSKVLVAASIAKVSALQDVL